MSDQAFSSQACEQDSAVDYVQGHGTFGPLLRSVQGSGVSILDLRVEDQSTVNGDNLRHVSMQVVSRRDGDLESVISDLAHRPEVKDARVFEVCEVYLAAIPG